MKKAVKDALRERIAAMAAHLFRNGAPLWDDEDSPPYHYEALGKTAFEVVVEGQVFYVAITAVSPNSKRRKHD